MKILFFGGTGLIGNNFYHYCKNKNFKFDIISRNKPDFKLRREDKWISFDILKNIKINLSKSYDVIIIGTTLTPSERLKFKKDDFYRINNCGIRNILIQIDNINFKKLIFLSSGIVYGRYGKRKPTEVSKFKIYRKEKLNEYSISKINAEKKILSFCNKKNKNYLILRIFSLIDFTINDNNFRYVVNIFLKSAVKSNNINILGNPKNMISYLDINTFNNILLKLLNKKHKNFILNIGSDKKTSIINLAQVISKIFKKKIKIKVSKKRLDQTFYVPNTNKLKKKIKNLNPLSIEKICKRILIKSKASLEQ